MPLVFCSKRRLQILDITYLCTIKRYDSNVVSCGVLCGRRYLVKMKSTRTGQLIVIFVIKQLLSLSLLQLHTAVHAPPPNALDKLEDMQWSTVRQKDASERARSTIYLLLFPFARGEVLPATSSLPHRRLFHPPLSRLLLPVFILSCLPKISLNTVLPPQPPYNAI